jgi:hypothetical protein
MTKEARMTKTKTGLVGCFVIRISFVFLAFAIRHLPTSLLQQALMAHDLHFHAGAKPQTPSLTFGSCKDEIC